MSCQDLAQTLIESFNALADEVQNLIDRKTILEHKLRFSHEQVSRFPANPSTPFPLHDEFFLALDLELL